MSRSGSKYTFPRDDNGVPFLGAASNTDGTSPIVLEADSDTHELLVKDAGVIAALESISGSVNYSTRIAEDSGNADITYIGNAALGASESDPVWQIKQLYSATGLDKTWCDGNDNFDNIWTNRESLSYS